MNCRSYDCVSAWLYVVCCTEKERESAKGRVQVERGAHAERKKLTLFDVRHSLPLAADVLCVHHVQRAMHADTLHREQHKHDDDDEIIKQKCYIEK